MINAAFFGSVKQNSLAFIVSRQIILTRQRVQSVHVSTNVIWDSILQVALVGLLSVL